MSCIGTFSVHVAGAWHFHSALHCWVCYPSSKRRFAPLAVAAALAGLLLFWRARARGFALLFAGLPLLTTVLAWWAAGQPIAALPDYFRSLVPLVAGYTDAMATYPDGRYWPLLRVALPGMLVAYLVVSAWALLATWRLSRGNGWRTAVLLGCLALFFFIAFKAGFVRQDQHALAAGSAPVLALLALRLFDLAQPGFWVSSVALATWLLTHSIYMPNTLEGTPIYNLSQALRGERVGKHLQAAFDQRLRDIRNQYPMAPLQGSTDIYPYDLAALIASGNRWMPRPMLQSYSAYTPSLARLNEAHLRGPAAPDNVVLRTANIDKRFPNMEDGLSWPTLMSHYAVTGLDPHYIYLKKKPAPTAWQRELLQKGPQHTDRVVDVPRSSGLLFAEIDIRPSLLGRISNVAYKTSLLEITVDLANGQSHSYRLVPSMARAGFILSPLVLSNADWVQLAQGPWQALQASAVKSLRVTPAQGGAAFWQPEYTLRLTAMAVASTSPAPLAKFAHSPRQSGTALAQQGAP
jgi:hypothetical protein